MKDTMRKKYQRGFNKKMRMLNKNIENDDLWLGRFVFLQKDCHWWRFEDNSGGELSVFVRAYDKQNGYYHDYRIEYAPWMKGFNWHLSMDVANKFITEDDDVWTSDNTPSRATAVDYRNVKVDVEKLMAQPWNWYCNAKNFKGEN